MKKLKRSTAALDVPVIELNGGMHVQQCLFQYLTSAEINNNEYDEVVNQKLKLFNRGKCHIWRTISI
jgi:hypothetical protein